jgi:superfamily II DNA or RNA helicase
MQLRRHQTEMAEHGATIAAKKERFRMLAHVACGGGKSWLPPLLMKALPENIKLCWVVPRLALQSQAVKGSKDDFAIDFRDSGNDTNPSRGLRGVVITQQAFSQNVALWVDEFRRHPYILLIDEPHHAKVSRAGVNNALANAIEKTERHVFGVVLMTGTLHTGDGQYIHGIEYVESDGGFETATESGFDYFIRYSRRDALEEGSIIPIEFFHDDGPVKWESLSTGEETQIRLSSADRKQEGNAIWTAINTGLATSLFERGYAHWKEKGNKLLVVCHSQARAKKFYADLLARGERAFLAVSDNDEAMSHIDAFKETPKACLVTCAMAYEGLDEKKLSHVICLTHIRSVPWIEQMLARVWRADKGKSCCYAFVPDDPRMNRVIDRIKSEEPDRKSATTGEAGNGGGGSTERDALPVSSDHLLTRRTLLDDDLAAGAYSEKQLKAIETLVSLGIDPNSANLQALVKELRSKTCESSNGHITPKQREKALCCEIANICREIDGKRSLEFGSTQKALIRTTRRPIGEMGVEELRRTLGYVKNLASR